MRTLTLALTLLALSAYPAQATPDYAGTADYAHVLRAGTVWRVPTTDSLSDVHCYSIHRRAYAQRALMWYLLRSNKVIAKYNRNNRTFYSYAERAPIICAAWKG